MKKSIGKICGWIVALILLGCILYFNQPKTMSGDRPVVKIGFIYPMSGSLGHIGKGTMTAAQMVLDKVNQNPNRQFNYQLIAQDDEMKAANAVTIANKMLFIDKVNLLVTSWSAQSNAVKPIAIKQNIPQFIGTYQSLSDGKNVFNYYVVSEDLAKKAFDFIYKRKAKKIALIFQDVIAGAEISSVLKPKLREKDIKYDEYLFAGNEFDAFRTMVAKIKANNYDLLILYGRPPGTVFIARELKSQEVKVPVFGFDTVEVANYDFTYFDGFYEAGNPYNPEWETLLKSKNTDSVYMYDAMNIVVDTYEKAGKKLGRVPTTKEFRETMYEQRDYQGLVGNVHLEDDGLFRIPAALKKVENGKIIMLDEGEI